MKMNIVSLQIQYIEDNQACITTAMAAEEDLQQRKLQTILINSYDYIRPLYCSNFDSWLEREPV